MKQWWKLLIISAQTTLGSVIPGPVLTLLVIVKKNKKIPYFQSRVTPISRQNTAAAKSLQSCLTLCDPIDGSPLGSPIPGILQARTLEWVAISFSNAWKWKVKGKSLSRVRLCATPWTAAHQAPPSMGLSRQEYWSRVPLPSPTVKYYSAIKRNEFCSNVDGCGGY